MVKLSEVECNPETFLNLTQGNLNHLQQVTSMALAKWKTTYERTKYTKMVITPVNRGNVYEVAQRYIKKMFVRG